MTTASQAPARPVSAAAGWAGFGLITTIWGSTFLVIAMGEDHVPPVWAAALRLLLAAVILLLVMAVTRVPFPRGAALRSAMGFGFFQFGLNFPLLYLGEKQVASGVAAVIFATIPLSQSVLTRAVGLERLTRSKVVGALVALGGVAAIFSTQITARVDPRGMLWVLLAVWAACIGTVTLKLGPRQSAVGSNAVGAAVGAVVCLIWSALRHEPHLIPTGPRDLLPILYLAIVGSVIAFVVMAWLLNRWEVTSVSYVSVVIPLVAMALGAWVRHERVGVPSLLGAGVVLAGVVIGLELWRPRRAQASGATSSSSRASTG